MTDDIQFLTEVLDLKTAKGYDFKVSPKDEWPGGWATLRFQAVFTSDQGVEYAFRVVKEKEYGRHSKRLILMKRNSKKYSQNIIIDKGTFKKVLVTFMRCYQAFKETDEGLRSSSYGLTLQKSLVQHAPLLVKVIAKAFRGQPKIKLEFVGVNEEGQGGGIDLLYINKLSTVPYWGGKGYDEAKFTNNDTYRKLAGIRAKSDQEPIDSDDVSTADGTTTQASTSSVNPADHKPKVNPRMAGLSSEAVAVTKEENWGPVLFNELNRARGREAFAEVLRKYSVHRHYMQKHFGELYVHLYGDLNKAIESSRGIESSFDWMEGMGFYLNRFKDGAANNVLVAKIATMGDLGDITFHQQSNQVKYTPGIYNDVEFARVITDHIGTAVAKVAVSLSNGSNGPISLESFGRYIKSILSNSRISGVVSRSRILTSAMHNCSAMAALLYCLEIIDLEDAKRIILRGVSGIIGGGVRGVTTGPDGKIMVTADAEQQAVKIFDAVRKLFPNTDLFSPNIASQDDAAKRISLFLLDYNLRSAEVTYRELEKDISDKSAFSDKVRQAQESLVADMDELDVKRIIGEFTDRFYPGTANNPNMQYWLERGFVAVLARASALNVKLERPTPGYRLGRHLIRLVDDHLQRTPGLSDKLDIFFETNSSGIWETVLEISAPVFNVVRLLGDFDYKDIFENQDSMTSFSMMRRFMHKYPKDVKVDMLKFMFDKNYDGPRGLIKMADNLSDYQNEEIYDVWGRFVDTTGYTFQDCHNAFDDDEIKRMTISSLAKFTFKHLMAKVDMTKLTDNEFWNIYERMGVNVKYDFSGRSKEFCRMVFEDCFERLGGPIVKAVFSDAPILSELAIDYVNTGKIDNVPQHRVFGFLEILPRTAPKEVAHVIGIINQFPLSSYDAEFKAMHFGDIIVEMKDYPEIQEAYDNLDKDTKREVFKQYVDTKITTQMAKIIQGDDVPVKPLVNLTPARIKQVMKYNSFKYPRRPVFKEDMGLLEALSKEVKSPEIPPVQVTKIARTEEELEAMSVTYDSFNRYKHGEISVKFLEEFDVHLPNTFDEWGKRYEEVHGEPSEYMHPVFHGTGSVAASMILRNGFTIIKSTDQSVAGRMLGDGIYFSNVLDKVSQYVAEGGITRGRGAKGYIFEMEAWLGKPRVDYRSAGTGGPADSHHRVVSPEWCVYNLGQLRIKKAYKIEIIDKYVMEQLKSKHQKLNEGKVVAIRDFQSFLGEAAKTKAPKAPKKRFVSTFVFMDGKIPVSKGKWVEFEKFDPKKYGPHVRVDMTQKGPVVLIDSHEQMTYLVRYVEDIMRDQLTLDVFLDGLKRK